ncbi:DotH/IcmK family type IV secretion protein [Vibrio crassostreae]|uniref:DotH/IcmK family type IV secretion protein n=1 Tax=Vibrio crassostreae TaxID=246167 RepID=UPI001B314719|nr:DotH/IcmK family type IV secretion protein [Vibrio crassostreae]
MKLRKLTRATGVALYIAIPLTAVSAEQNEAPIPLDLKESRETEISDLAIKQVERKQYPLTEAQADAFKYKQEEYERYINEPIRDPDVQNRTIEITPSISQNENVILSSVNYTTNLVFVDSLGEPWPIKKIGVGAMEFFTVDQYLEHALTIIPKQKYKKSNLTIILDGLETVPIMLSLKEDKNLVDYIVQARVNGFNKNSNAHKNFNYKKIKPKLIDDTNKGLMHIQHMTDDITPEGGERLSVIKYGNHLQGISAWRYKDKQYIRTQGELIIPTGDVISTSVDNYKLYATPPISSIMVEQDGVIMTDIKIIKEKTPSYETEK